MNKGHFMVTIVFGAAMFVAGSLLRPVIWPGREQEEAALDTAAEIQQLNAKEINVQELSVQELAAQGYLSLETLAVRIDDGEIQWYDGAVWHTAATVEAMEKEDKFYAAEEDFRNFEEQMKQQMENDRAEQESTGESGEMLLVGQKEEPKPTEKPKSTKPAVTAPVTVPVAVPEPAAPTEDNDGSNPGSGDSGNAGGSNPGGGNSGNTGGSNPGGGDGENSGNTGESNPGGGDGGNSDNTDGNNPGGGTDSDSGSGENTGGDSGSSGTDTGDGENMEWSDDYL